MVKDVDDVRERESRRSLLTRERGGKEGTKDEWRKRDRLQEREGEEGTKDEWMKRDCLPSRLFHDWIIFYCERERGDCLLLSSYLRIGEMRGYRMTNSYCVRKLGGDGKGEWEKKFSPPPPYAHTHAHAGEKEGEKMESMARERGFKCDRREIHRVREKKERWEIVE